MTLQSDMLVSDRLRLRLNVDFDQKVNRHIWDLVVFVEGHERTYRYRIELPFDPDISESLRSKLAQTSAEEIIRQLKRSGVIRKRRWWDEAKDERGTA
jgi:hypothetical protein